MCAKEKNRARDEKQIRRKGSEKTKGQRQGESKTEREKVIDGHTKEEIREKLCVRERGRETETARELARKRARKGQNSKPTHTDERESNKLRQTEIHGPSFLFGQKD